MKVRKQRKKNYSYNSSSNSSSRKETETSICVLKAATTVWTEYLWLKLSWMASRLLINGFWKWEKWINDADSFEKTSQTS